MKSLFGYGQQQMQSQFQDRLARVLGVGQMGQNAATNEANIAQGGSNSIVNSLSDIGAANAGGTLGAANANIGGVLGAANSRIGGMQNASWLKMYGQGQMDSGISDLAGRFAGPLTQYASNFQAPTPGLIF